MHARVRFIATCATHARLRPASLLVYDVTTLHFETDAPSWLILVFKFSADLGDRFAEVVG